MNKTKVEDLVRKDTISGGMLPKTRSCFEALEAGCAKFTSSTDGFACPIIV